MSTTSGRCVSAASTAAEPSATDATTSTSGRIPSSSSSASRKTGLSSTRTIRTGRTGRTLFRREQELVVRLAAVVQLDLELGPLGGEPLEERLQPRRLGSDEQREEAAPVARDPLHHVEGDVGEVAAGSDGFARDEPEPVATLRLDARRGVVAGGDRHLTRFDRCRRLAHLRRVLARRA